MGVINVTPDSFSDGGRFATVETALAQARRLAGEGADILDIGGESTRPGAAAVGTAEEIDRVLPVIEAIARELDVRLSVDTRKHEVAEAAILAGATLINDVSGGRDGEMLRLASHHAVDILLMHMRGEPATMQLDPDYPEGVVNEVKGYLERKVHALAEAGIPRSRVWIDPGIGFGKTLEQNLELLHSLDRLDGIADRIAIGTSRKSFLARVLGDPGLPFEAREPGTVASCLFARAKGASVFRVHDVLSLKRALTTWEAMQNAL